MFNCIFIVCFQLFSSYCIFQDLYVYVFFILPFLIYFLFHCCILKCVESGIHVEIYYGFYYSYYCFDDFMIRVLL